MKKSISLLIVLALILSLFALVGCGGEEDASQDALNVTVVVSSSFGDKSFIDSAKEGTDHLAADMEGVTVEYIECNHEGIKQQLMDAADKSDMVVAVGWECYDISDVAPEYPDVKFIFVDNPAENIEDIPNLLCITYAQNEGSFLAGYIAANMSQTGVIGAVGGEDDATINDFIKGYKQGAEYANEDIKVEVVYADGDYENPALGKEYALELYGKGADVIFNIAGKTGDGIFEAAQENSFYAIGVDADQKLTNPDFDDVIICSVKKDIGTSIYDAIVSYVNEGTWNGAKVVVNDMTSGYISIAYGDENSTQQIGEDLKAEVEELTDQIVSGEIEVKTTR